MDASAHETTRHEDTWSRWRERISNRFRRYISALWPLHVRNDDSDTRAFSTAEELPEDRESPLPQHLRPAEAVVIIEEPACRICHESINGKGKNRLVAPCKCRGSAEYVHKRCLHKWCETKKTADCEICHSPYQRNCLKSPSLPASDENSLVSSSMVLTLLFAVTGASIFLFLTHLAAVEYAFHGDSWLLLFLVIGSLFGFIAFSYWFVKNCRRILRNRRESLREGRESNPVTLSGIATGT